MADEEEPERECRDDLVLERDVRCCWRWCCCCCCCGGGGCLLSPRSRIAGAGGGAGAGCFLAKLSTAARRAAESGAGDAVAFAAGFGAARLYMSLK